MLKRYFLPIQLIALLLSVHSVRAEVPNLISYQGRLTETDGSPVPDGDYNLTFQMVEHDPLPMGETPLWSSGVQAVTVTDGLFVYYLGSNEPLPSSLFSADTLDSHYVRVLVEGSPVASIGMQLVSVPFAFKSDVATVADTAAYAHSGPGSGATGWVDDGSVVRLQSGGDRVGIGTTSPGENLVVGGGDLGSYEGAYIVSANSEWDDYSGYKLGWNLDNHATINWHGDGDQLRFHTRSLGTSHNDNLVLRSGYVGIGVDYPLEPLVVGVDLGAYYGDFVQMGRVGSGRYSGFMCGEDENNRGTMMWYNNSNELRFGYKTGGVDYGNHLTLKDGQMILTGTGDASVQLPTGSVSNTEILNESGIGHFYSPGDYIYEGHRTLLMGRPMDFPTTGYAVVLVTLETLVCNQTAGSIFLAFSISDSPVEHNDVRYHLTTNYPDHCAEWTVTFQRVIEVTTPGVRNIYVLGHYVDLHTDQAFVEGDMTIMFFPTWYGTTGGMAESVSQPTAVSDGPSGLQQSGVEQLVAARVQAETEAIRADFEQQLQAMREEFQQQLEGINK